MKLCYHRYTDDDKCKCSHNHVDLDQSVFLSLPLFCHLPLNLCVCVEVSLHYRVFVAAAHHWALHRLLALLTFFEHLHCSLLVVGVLALLVGHTLVSDQCPAPRVCVSHLVLCHSQVLVILDLTLATALYEVLQLPIPGVRLQHCVIRQPLALHLFLQDIPVLRLDISVHICILALQTLLQLVEHLLAAIVLCLHLHIVHHHPPHLIQLLLLLLPLNVFQDSLGHHLGEVHPDLDVLDLSVIVPHLLFSEKAVQKCFHPSTYCS